MNILLIESDSALRQTWVRRLQTLDVGVTVIVDDSDWAHLANSPEPGLALCRITRDDKDLDYTAHLLRQHGHQVIAIATGGDRALHRAAYAAGFDDCIDDNCDSKELQSKIEHADYLQRIDQRLAQAQKLESIGELAAGIAHEINTPIQYVGDNTRFVQGACRDLGRVLESCQEVVRLLEDGVNPAAAVVRLRELMKAADVDYLSEEIPSAIGQTLDGIDRVTNIVRAMKEFAHPGTNEMTLTNLSHAINNTVMVARNEWKYVAELDTVFDDQLPDVPCLPGELNQVLLNMIVNAAHAIGEAVGGTPESKGRITITTSLVDSFAEIRISDTGRGVEPENVDRIFKPFFTTKAAGKGTGQGLAIAHNVIVEKHRGTIDVTSEVGRGTEFVIRLPLHKSNHNAADPPSIVCDASA